MKYLPVFLDITITPSLVVGGGVVAARKVEQLRRANAQVTVVAPELCSELSGLADAQLIKYVCSDFSEDNLQDKMLVIAATDDANVNKRVSELAKERNLPVNVVDNPELCSFIMPSIVDRDPVQIAISTGGASPVLARLLRARLESLIPSSYGNLAKLMRKFRAKVKAKLPDMQQRRRYWENVLQGPIAEMIYAGQEELARNALEKTLSAADDVVNQTGEVYLVGAGPGDPDLLTFRALRLMQQAEVVLYDRLVAPVIVDLCRKDAERIYVGKKRDQHALPQAEISQLLADLAKQGKRVLRLKGGDPFIFGRGGEEIELLAAENIPFQVIPGITSASGCASYAGIPLTHRDYANTCVFITGHLKDGSMDLNWETLIQPGQTIAVYMGVMCLEVLSRELIARGLPKTMPAALIQQGTTPQQKVYIGDLATLPEISKQKDIKPPTMIIIGEVVKLHESLSWFEPQE
jgi:uroporphyrin-III C-methyltransferase / precorrin-2 dehydrogenase / sirohydrochlorin ferrochelatase